MVKFKVLEYNQYCLARIGIHLHRLNEPTNEFFKTFVSYYYLFVFIILVIVSSGVFAWKSWPHMDMVSEPCLAIIGGFQATGMYLSIGLKIKKLKVLHIELQEIIDATGISLSYSEMNRDENHNLFVSSRE